MIPQFLADMAREQNDASRAMEGVQSNLAESITEIPMQNVSGKLTAAQTLVMSWSG
jgi:hypothetical protein